MLVNVDAARLRAFLEGSEDAEALGGGEYTVDLYDVDTPVSMDILLSKKGSSTTRSRTAGIWARRSRTPSAWPRC